MAIPNLPIRLDWPHKWFYIATNSEPLGRSTETVNLSIKNVPDDLAEKLRRRALKNHRSLQGELMAILEEALNKKEVLTPSELLTEVKKMKLLTEPDSACWIREDRDAAH
jgi:antitoxin FitA